MIDGNRWILAVIALASGLLLGEIAGPVQQPAPARWATHDLNVDPGCMLR